jgi:hypothetical protein
VLLPLFRAAAAFSCNTSGAAPPPLPRFAQDKLYKQLNKLPLKALGATYKDNEDALAKLIDSVCVCIAPGEDTHEDDVAMATFQYDAYKSAIMQAAAGNTSNFPTQSTTSLPVRHDRESSCCWLLRRPARWPRRLQQHCHLQQVQPEPAERRHSQLAEKPPRLLLRPILVSGGRGQQQQQLVLASNNTNIDSLDII